MLYLDGKIDGWQTFDFNHKKAIVKTLLIVASTFYYSKMITVVFSSKIGDSVSLHLKLAIFEEKMGENP